MKRLAILVALAAAAAADPVTLKIRLPKGKSWKIEQTVGLVSDAQPPSKLKNGATVTTGTKTPFMLAEKWTDACVEEKDGAPDQIRRTVASSRLQSAKNAAAPTKSEGCAFLVVRSEKRCTVKVEKGKPDDLSVKLMQKSPPDLVEMLLPDHEVGEGDEWEVKTLDVMDFMVAAEAGLAGAQGPNRNEMSKEIEDLDGSGKPFGMGSGASAACIVKTSLKSVKDGVATVEFSGGLDDDNLPGGAKMPEGMPHTKTEVSGTLTFNVKDGQPVKLSLHQKHIHDRQKVEGGEIPGFTEDWAIVRTYSTK